MSERSSGNLLSAAAFLNGVLPTFARRRETRTRLAVWLGVEGHLGDVAGFMNRESMFVHFAFAEVNLLAAYPARKGLGNHVTPLT